MYLGEGDAFHSPTFFPSLLCKAKPAPSRNVLPHTSSNPSHSLLILLAADNSASSSTSRPHDVS